MIAAFIAVLLINIGLWIVFVIRYKKRFSSEKYLSEVRTELNNLTADINRTTERNIQLIQAAVNRSKALSREIDVKLDMLDKKLALINSDIETKQNAPQLLNTVNFSELKEKLHSAAEFDEEPVARGFSEQAYEPVTRKTSSNAYSSLGQKINSLVENDFESSVLDIRDEITITSEGAAYKEVPVISPKRYPDPQYTYPLKRKQEKDISSQVMELYTGGKTVSEIAQILSLSVTEVQFMIDLG